MTKPAKWDWKTWAAIAAFCGVTSLGTLISQAKKLVGWLSEDTVKTAQEEGLDSLRVMFARVRAADSVEAQALKASVDSMARGQRYVIRVLRKMPQAKAAAREIEREDREQETFLGRRAIADHTTTRTGDRTR